MTMAIAVERGRVAFAEHRWDDAFKDLADADAERTLLAEDLERFSTVAFLLGRDGIAIETGQRAHQQFLATGDVAGAARCAAWLGVSLLSMGDFTARSSGWLARAHRLVQETDEATSVSGLLLIPTGLGALLGGDPEGAARAFDEAFSIGYRFRDADLMALAQLGQGQAKIMFGELGEGLALFDEAMIAVTAGEIAPIPSGIIYCAVIGNCHRAFDLRRAHEWTIALDQWCGDRPDMVLFSGQCQMHRAQLYFLHGAWTDALRAARAAQDKARRGDREALYGGWYQQGEIQRLCGELDEAEDAFGRAAQSGYDPEPGLALLRLAQGKPQLAQSLIERAVEGSDPGGRRLLLPGLVEIELAVGDVAAARRGADELHAMSGAIAMPLVQAHAHQAEGAVLLAEGEAGDALNTLRRAWAHWQELDAPYETARCRVLVARAYRALGDEDSVSIELEPARAIFAELGARPALAETDAWSRGKSEGTAGLLTAREVEVLRLVSEGKTNRVIAGELYLSEKTVAHHLSNMFTKLGLSSRAAATAYAYEHGLV
ncbi:MAG: response regulator transcription factor [Homoserinimonas sp.]